MAGLPQGDSGFVVLRAGQVVLHSEPLQHHFDCPLQFGHPTFGTLTDWADNADVYSVEVQPGDVVVTGSDGLWDNCFTEELLQLLPKCAGEVLRVRPRASSKPAGVTCMPTAKHHAEGFQQPLRGVS
jgi:hypothetical protein